MQATTNEKLNQPFDTSASTYDTNFTNHILGQWLREIVWEHLAKIFHSGDHILELGCGTGEDAIWLAQKGVQVTATDASLEMLAVARKKAEAAGVGGQIDFLQFDMEDIGDWILDISTTTQSSITNTQYPIPNTNGIFSNFGPLNCLPDRRPLSKALSGWLQPGDKVLLVLMGPFCPWEIGWHLGHGQVRTAFRRLRSGVEANIGNGNIGGIRIPVRVWYPSPRRLQAEFGPFFRHVKTVGVGFFLPPSYLGHLVDRWPAFYENLSIWDRKFGHVFPLNWLSDHYLTIFERI